MIARPVLRNLITDVPGLGSGSALQWFVPGIVAMSCLFGASMTGSNLLFEMQTGSHEGTLVTPLSRPSPPRDRPARSGRPDLNR